MKLLVAFDDHGRILAAAESRPGATHVRPETMLGAHVEELELPKEFHGKKPHELPPFRVDVAGRKLVKAN